MLGHRHPVTLNARHGRPTMPWRHLLAGQDGDRITNFNLELASASFAISRPPNSRRRCSMSRQRAACCISVTSCRRWRCSFALIERLACSGRSSAIWVTMSSASPTASRSPVRRPCAGPRGSRGSQPNQCFGGCSYAPTAVLPERAVASERRRQFHRAHLTRLAFQARASCRGPSYSSRAVSSVTGRPWRVIVTELFRCMSSE